MTPTLLLRLRRWWRAARRKASTVNGKLFNILEEAIWKSLHGKAELTELGLGRTM
jgi:hypothetical protein